MIADYPLYFTELIFFLSESFSVVCCCGVDASLFIRLASIAAIIITPIIVTAPTIISKTIPKWLLIITLSLIVANILNRQGGHIPLP
jgi:hypothetical protein